MVQENCPVPAGPDTGRYGDALPDNTYADDACGNTDTDAAYCYADADDAGSNTYAGDSCGNTDTDAA